MLGRELSKKKESGKNPLKFEIVSQLESGRKIGKITLAFTLPKNCRFFEIQPIGENKGMLFAEICSLKFKFKEFASHKHINLLKGGF